MPNDLPDTPQNVVKFPGGGLLVLGGWVRRAAPASRCATGRVEGRREPTAINVVPVCSTAEYWQADR
jgi:hypothetical protein